MDGGRASLVLASCPPPSRPDGAVLTDDPAWIGDPSRDVLFDDLLLPDRYALRRYEAAREAFSRQPTDRFPGAAADYAYAFVQAHVDLSVRIERTSTFIRDRGAKSLRIPASAEPPAWAAAEAARRLGVTVETYAVAAPASPSAEGGRSRVARVALRILGPILRMRYQRRSPRILTADLGLLDVIVPHFASRTGILSPGLGVAVRAARGGAAYAWVRHAGGLRAPDLQTTVSLDEAARILSIQQAGPLPELVTRLQDALSSGLVDAVVLSEDKAPVSHACVRLAAAAGIPSLVVQHGITGHPVGFLPLEATRFVSWGRACSDWLVSRGVPSTALVAAGDPRYDALFRNRANLGIEGRSLLAAVGVPRDSKVAILFSQPAEGRAAVYRMVLEAIAGLPLKLVTKIHPAEVEGFYHGLARRHGGDAPVVSGSAEPYLAAADIALTQSSGLAVVAAQLGTPTILLEPVTLENIQAYDARWPRASDAASLRAQLDSVLRGTYDRERLRVVGEDYGGPADGHAGERVARIIEGMVKERA